MKEQYGMARREMTQMPALIYCGEVVLWKWTRTRELKPTAAYRLGIDKGGR
jgi:hypothetical protein